MTTRQVGTWAPSTAAAANPSSPGISISSNATSGRFASVLPATSSPRPIQATTSKSSSRSSRAHRAEPTVLVVGEQQADRHRGGAPVGWSDTRSRHPRGRTGLASTVPPAAATRSRSPASPFPDQPAPPTPSSAISTTDDVRVTVPGGVAVKGAFLSPSARPSREAVVVESITSVAVGSTAVMPEARAPFPLGELAGESHLSILGDRSADVGEGVADNSSTSPISWAQAAWSLPTSRRASPAFTVMAVSEWPSRSCRSRRFGCVRPARRAGRSRRGRREALVGRHDLGESRRHEGGEDERLPGPSRAPRATRSPPTVREGGDSCRGDER